MSNVPEDIKQAATMIANKYLGFEISCQRLYTDVVAAIQEERRRCDCIVRRSDIATLQKSEAILKGEQP